MEHIRKSHPELVAEVEIHKKQGADEKNDINDKARKHQKTIQQLLKNFTTDEVCFHF